MFDELSLLMLCHSRSIVLVRLQASFLCMGNRFATATLNQALTLSREAIKRGEPLLVGTYKLGIVDLADGRLFNSYTTSVFEEAKVQCINKTIYLWVPIFLKAPQVLFDLKLLTNIDAGEFLLYFDQLFANVTVAIPRPPKVPGARSKVLKFQFLGSPGIGFRSPTRGPLSAAFSAVLNLLLRTFKFPAERIVEIIIEDRLMRYLENNDLPL
ncbi:uncharacterized protein LOC114828562 [Galendromus occidentalis]|uniref:Uncharacterized protein LOC114828562 n=1 Tax=Galendromus occidentalis TaxID=34638 RepID=A0AAJ7SHY1_9ACAR|nr:uncharacterized protein LOC114828562 [Galendromus occidentalis]